MWFQLPKLNIHLEITSQCQAKCPACARVYDYNPDVLGSKKPSHFTLDKLKEVFNESVLSRINEFFLCGNYGDPLAHPKLAQWIDHIQGLAPSVKFWLHTNGGLGSKETWAKLGAHLSRPEDMVCFAIDGLEDTNSIYRRGVNWRTLIQNIEIFVDCGGRAEWKFIKFPHNMHQIEEARELSTKLGFRRFKVINPYPGFENYLNESSDIPTDSQFTHNQLSESELTTLLAKSKNVEIKCDALAEKSLYIDHEARVWPCCWLGMAGDLRTRYPEREEFHRFLFEQNKYETHFNNLFYYQFNDILNHDLFKEKLKENWSSQSQCLSTCAQKCGSNVKETIKEKVGPITQGSKIIKL